MGILVVAAYAAPQAPAAEKYEPVKKKKYSHHWILCKNTWSKLIGKFTFSEDCVQSKIVM